MGGSIPGQVGSSIPGQVGSSIPGQVGGSIPGQVVLGWYKKADEKAMESKVGSSTPSWSLLECLPPGSCYSFCPVFP